jgi:hypothetical protein
VLASNLDKLGILCIRGKRVIGVGRAFENRHFGSLLISWGETAALSAAEIEPATKPCFTVLRFRAHILSSPMAQPIAR